MRLPNDFNSIELELYNFLSSGSINSTTVDIYKKLDDPVDKFLVAYVFELNNTRKMAQEALGLSKTTVWYKIKRIKRILRDYYRIEE